MAKAYVLLQFNVSDPKKFALYRQNAAATILTHGGKALVAPAAPDVKEGSLPVSRVTILEFPSREAVEAWYGSADYAGFKHLRHEASSEASFVFLDGFEPPVGKG